MKRGIFKILKIETESADFMTELTERLHAGKIDIRQACDEIWDFIYD